MGSIRQCGARREAVGFRQWKIGTCILCSGVHKCCGAIYTKSDFRVTQILEEIEIILKYKRFKLVFEENWKVACGLQHVCPWWWYLYSGSSSFSYDLSLPDLICRLCRRSHFSSSQIWAAVTYIEEVIERFAAAVDGIQAAAWRPSPAKQDGALRVIRVMLGF